MLKFEYDYMHLVKDVIGYGERRETRNGITHSLFARRLVIDELCYGYFPLLSGRKIFTKGIFGELAAMMRAAGGTPLEHIDQLKEFGCNYWDKWADEEGNLTIDYGNEWYEGGQIKYLKHCLANDRTNRRMLITGWNPRNLDELSLPCCHYAYQFYVDNSNRLHMLWNQRSVDVMVGLPSDIVFAAAWLIMIANEFSLQPGIITMDFGDTHIYEGHLIGAQQYLRQAKLIEYDIQNPRYNIKAEQGKDFLQFVPGDIEITNYNPMPKVEFELYE